MDTSPHFTAYPLEDYSRHKSEIDAAILKMLAQGHYILGEEVGAFEKEFAAFVGAKEAIGVANGTDAIELILRGLDIGHGAVVAAPSHTAVASISAISRAGASAVFVDVEPDTFTMCPESLENTLSSAAGAHVKAVLAVHLYGHPADVTRLQAVCDQHGVVLIEDCAQAHGAAQSGRSAGAMGRAASFSFYPTKNLGAIGDGGGITTNDEGLAEKIRWIRQYGWKRRYISDVEGVNSRLDELQAAILRVKLRSLATGNENRRKLAARYTAGLEGTGIAAPVCRSGCTHVYHLYVVRSRNRDALMRHMLEKHIPVALHYPAAVHQQPAYELTRQRSLPLPHTDALIPEILSLPLHPFLGEDAVEATLNAARQFAEIAA